MLGDFQLVAEGEFAFFRIVVVQLGTFDVVRSKVPFVERLPAVATDGGKAIDRKSTLGVLLDKFNRSCGHTLGAFRGWRPQHSLHRRIGTRHPVEKKPAHRRRSRNSKRRCRALLAWSVLPRQADRPIPLHKVPREHCPHC